MLGLKLNHVSKRGHCSMWQTAACATTTGLLHAIWPIVERKMLVLWDSSQENVTGYLSVSTHQWAMHATWLWGIPSHRAHDLVVEFATSSHRDVFLKKTGRDHHVLVMATLCQREPYAELQITALCRALWSWKRVSRLPLPHTTVQWKDLAALSVWPTRYSKGSIYIQFI